MRLKAITNIQKITKTMKMISAAKYAQAAKAIVPARAYGVGALAIYEKAEVEVPKVEDGPVLYVAISSDRGLCGALHSSIGREVKTDMESLPAGTEVGIITVGEKVKAFLQSTHGKDFLMECKEIGRTPPNFTDASGLADQILLTGYKYGKGVIVYNWFKSAMTQVIKQQPMFTQETLSQSPAMTSYDSIDEEVLQSFQEFQLANTMYYAIKENYTSEQGARMVSMDGATKNAGEIIDKMSLQFNRTRQAVITTELTEIISGVAALEDK